MDAYEVAERMRKRIADQVISIEDAQVRVTVSIGGSLRERIADIEEAIRQADAALYRAKEAGRNRTILASGDESSPDGTV